ncbi:MAG: DUF4368 domain-containing protein [Clostridiales bacterium]|nr:DUF4368 domain-containing protein [Clostridiales bacterium]
MDKIYISKTSGKKRLDKTREIEIVYNFIGAFDFQKAREQSQIEPNKKETVAA